MNANISTPMRFEASYSLQHQHDTNFGPIAFGDGIQSWVNRGFAFQARHRLRDWFRQ